jgi:glycine reductase
VVSGDPSWAGSLGGVALGLPVYHIMEPEIKEQIDPEVYQKQVGLMEIALDVGAITKGLDNARKGSG